MPSLCSCASHHPTDRRAPAVAPSPASWCWCRCRASPEARPVTTRPRQHPLLLPGQQGPGACLWHGTIVQWRFGHVAYQAQIPADRAWRPAERQPGAAAAAGLRSADAPARLLRAHLQQPRRGRLGVSPPRRQRGLQGRRGNGQLPHGRFCPWQGPARVLPGRWRQHRMRRRPGRLPSSSSSTRRKWRGWSDGDGLRAAGLPAQRRPPAPCAVQPAAGAVPQLPLWLLQPPQQRILPDRAGGSQRRQRRCRSSNGWSSSGVSRGRRICSGGGGSSQPQPQLLALSLPTGDAGSGQVQQRRRRPAAAAAAVGIPPPAAAAVFAAAARRRCTGAVLLG